MRTFSNISSIMPGISGKVRIKNSSHKQSNANFRITVRTEGPGTEREDQPGDLAEELAASGILLRMPERDRSFRNG